MLPHTSNPFLLAQGLPYSNAPFNPSSVSSSSSNQLLNGAAFASYGHIYKENKLKMTKHSGASRSFGANDLSTNPQDFRSGLNILTNQKPAHQPHYSKKRKVEETDSYIPQNPLMTMPSHGSLLPHVLQPASMFSQEMLTQLGNGTRASTFVQQAPFGNLTCSNGVCALPSNSNFDVMSMNNGATMAVGANATKVLQAHNATKATTSKVASRGNDGDYNIVVGEVLQSIDEGYEVLSFLGRGTFGQVVKCQSRSSNRVVAIKILKNHPSYLRQGNVEIQILQTLSQQDTESHNIVRAIECFQHKSHMCLVFELLEQNLYEFLKSNKFRPLALREIRPIAQQVLTALSKLKTLGLIHADLKPENIMLVCPSDGIMRYRVKVIDFGSACHSSKAIQNTYLQSRYYRAPEILLGLPFNEAIDMWSLGCVIAELFLGWPLYPGSSEYDQIRYIVETQGLPPTDLLKVAGKGGRFFIREPYTCDWRIKTQEEYTLETSNHPKEARKYIFSSLEQIREVDLNPSSGGRKGTVASTATIVSSCQDVDADIERQDRFYFTQLLTEMLQLRPSERIVPDVALAHSFITMNYLWAYPSRKRTQESFALMQVCNEACRRQRSLEVAIKQQQQQQAIAAAAQAAAVQQQQQQQQAIVAAAQAARLEAATAFASAVAAHHHQQQHNHLDAAPGFYAAQGPQQPHSPVFYQRAAAATLHPPPSIYDQILAAQQQQYHQAQAPPPPPPQYVQQQQQQDANAAAALMVQSAMMAAAAAAATVSPRQQQPPVVADQGSLSALTAAVAAAAAAAASSNTSSLRYHPSQVKQAQQYMMSQQQRAAIGAPQLPCVDYLTAAINQSNFEYLTESHVAHHQQHQLPQGGVNVSGCASSRIPDNFEAAAATLLAAQSNTIPDTPAYNTLTALRRLLLANQNANAANQLFLQTPAHPQQPQIHQQQLQQLYPHLQHSKHDQPAVHYPYHQQQQANTNVFHPHSHHQLQRQQYMLKSSPATTTATTTEFVNPQEHQLPQAPPQPTLPHQVIDLVADPSSSPSGSSSSSSSPRIVAVHHLPPPQLTSATKTMATDGYNLQPPPPPCRQSEQSPRGGTEEGNANRQPPPLTSQTSPTVRCPSNETDSSSHASVAVRFPRIMGINNISAILAASSGDGSLDIIGSPSQQLEEAHHSTSTVFHHQSIGVAINGSDDDNDEPVQNNVVSVTATTTGDHRCNESFQYAPQNNEIIPQQDVGNFRQVTSSMLVRPDKKIPVGRVQPMKKEDCGSRDPGLHVRIYSQLGGSNRHNNNNKPQAAAAATSSNSCCSSSGIFSSVMPSSEPSTNANAAAIAAAASFLLGQQHQQAAGPAQIAATHVPATQQLGDASAAYHNILLLQHQFNLAAQFSSATATPSLEHNNGGGGSTLERLAAQFMAAAAAVAASNNSSASSGHHHRYA